MQREECSRTSREYILLEIDGCYLSRERLEGLEEGQILLNQSFAMHSARTRQQVLDMCTLVLTSLTRP